MIIHTIESCWIPSQNKGEWPWRYRSRSKVITCDTPSHASDHLFQIWKESIQNYRRYTVDTIFKVKTEWPWKYRSRSKVITWDTPTDANDDLCQIWKECKQNCRIFFKVKAERLEKLAKNWNFKFNTRPPPPPPPKGYWLFVANMEIIDLELKTLQSGHDF